MWSIQIYLFFPVYFEASDMCNSLDFQLGNTANGVSTVATRSWSIRVSQYSCDYENLAPTGCNQWYFGSGATGYIYSFNYSGGKHLANQRQVSCIRREAGNCKVCYSADAATDIALTLDTTKTIGYISVSLYYNYLGSHNVTLLCSICTVFKYII